MTAVKGPVPVRVRIHYVDGAEVEVAADEWPRLRGDGVDWVRILHQGSTLLQAHSLYWLYREGSTWVAGCGSVSYDPNPLVELLFMANGTMREREREFMPDLPHSAVKLGWWWVGTDGPVETRPE